MTEAPSTLADRLAIMHALALYCHGVDRCDPATLSRAFWPDATVDYGAFKGPASAFMPAVITALTQMRCTSHAISNVMIEFEGSLAKVETYCRAMHVIPGADGDLEMEVGGRYIDVMQRRDVEWRIARRVYVMDWNRNVPSSAQWDEGRYATLTNRGARSPADPYDTTPLAPTIPAATEPVGTS